MTQISGKLVGKWTVGEFEDATIELPTVDVNKIHREDYILVKAKVLGKYDWGVTTYSFLIQNEDIIHHFSKQEDEITRKTREAIDKAVIESFNRVLGQEEEKKAEPKAVKVETAELPREENVMSIIDKGVDYGDTDKLFSMVCSLVVDLNDTIKVVKQMQDKIERGK